MLPLLAAYTVYSLFYNEHRSWWSFVIGVLYSFLSVMGFVQLVPQLIINYVRKTKKIFCLAFRPGPCSFLPCSSPLARAEIVQH